MERILISVSKKRPPKGSGRGARMAQVVYRENGKSRTAHVVISKDDPLLQQASR